MLQDLAGGLYQAVKGGPSSGLVLLVASHGPWAHQRGSACRPAVSGPLQPSSSLFLITRRGPAVELPGVAVAEAAAGWSVEGLADRGRRRVEGVGRRHSTAGVSVRAAAYRGSDEQGRAGPGCEGAAALGPAATGREPFGQGSDSAAGSSCRPCGGSSLAVSCPSSAVVAASSPRTGDLVRRSSSVRSIDVIYTAFVRKQRDATRRRMLTSSPDRGICASQSGCRRGVKAGWTSSSASLRFPALSGGQRRSKSNPGGMVSERCSAIVVCRSPPVGPPCQLCQWMSAARPARDERTERLLHRLIVVAMASWRRWSRAAWRSGAGADRRKTLPFSFP